MAVDERRRSELYQAVASALGEGPAQTMFELLPPDAAQLATKSDIAALDERFAAIDQRFEDQNRYLDARLDSMRDELLAAFRAELVTAVSGQTRAVILAVAAATFGIGGLAVTLAQIL